MTTNRLADELMGAYRSQSEGRIAGSFGATRDPDVGAGVTLPPQLG